MLYLQNWQKSDKENTQTCWNSILRFYRIWLYSLIHLNFPHSPPDTLHIFSSAIYLIVLISLISLSSGSLSSCFTFDHAFHFKYRSSFSAVCMMKSYGRLKTQSLLLSYQVWPGLLSHCTHKEKGSLHWVLRKLCRCVCYNKNKHFSHYIQKVLACLFSPWSVKILRLQESIYIFLKSLSDCSYISQNSWL